MSPLSNGRSDNESERLHPEVRGLVRALRRNAPHPSWSPRDHRDAFEAAAVSRPVDDTVRITEVDTPAGPAEWHIPQETRAAETVLYLHGGGFIMGSLMTTRSIASHLAAAIGRRLLVLGYDLAPEYRFPHQLEQTLSCHRWLAGEMAGPVVLAGDSAGASLAVGAAQRLARNNEVTPRALLLLSPMLDLRLRADTIDAHAPFDPQTPRWLLESMVKHYLGEAVDSDDPRASPLLGYLGGLPPTLVQVGELEALFDDAEEFSRVAYQAGAPVDLRVWSGMIHVWHAFAPRLSAATEAMREAGAWLDQLPVSDSHGT